MKTNPCSGPAWLAVLALCGLASAQIRIREHLGSAAGDELGTRLAAAGDVDADGVPDYLAAAKDTSQGGYVRVWSGRDGRQLHEFRSSSMDFGRGVCGATDVDRDGHADIIIGIPQYPSNGSGALEVYSGASGQLLQRILNPGSRPDIFGYALAGLGDVNADGHGDFAVLSSSSNEIRAYSGASFTVLWTAIGNANNDPNRDSFSLAGDVDGDGVEDLLHGNPRYGGSWNGEVVIYSGVSGRAIRSLHGSLTVSSEFGAAVAGIGDLDGDGRAEVAVGGPIDTDPQTGLRCGSVRVFLGASGAMAHEIYGGKETQRQFAGAVSAAGDLNSDGYPDLAVGAPYSAGKLQVLSGLSGGELMVLEGSGSERLGSHLASVGDLDGDGFPELAVSSTGYDGYLLNQGRVQIISGRIVATVSSLGTGCGGGPFVPILGATRPRLGQAWTLEGDYSPGGSAGVVLLGATPSIAFNMGFPGCDLHIDLAAFMIPTVFTTPASRWSLTLNLPALPTLAGQRLAGQVLYAPTQGPLGFDLTNGILLRVGY